MGYHEYVTLIETISIVDPFYRTFYSSTQLLCVNHIYLFGTEEQRKNGFPSFVREALLAPGDLPNTIPVQMPKGMSTTARKEGDQWVLNGTKNFITHGISGDIAVVIAQKWRKRRQSRNDQLL